jgi:hypothetical protein
MEEGTKTKAIPLRRSRVVARPATADQRRGWVDGIRDGLSTTIAPARHLWLAGLGGATLTVRAAQRAWAELVAEGVATEASFRRMLGRSPQRGEAQPIA